MPMLKRHPRAGPLPTTLEGVSNAKGNTGGAIRTLAPWPYGIGPPAATQERPGARKGGRAVAISTTFDPVPHAKPRMLNRKIGFFSHYDQRPTTKTRMVKGDGR